MTAVTEGSPGSALLEYAETELVNFVAMGTHGYTGIDRVLLGSTTERLIRNASVPVMSVRTEDGA
jgi:nucleotide-binding universal stress UspA family protein